MLKPHPSDELIFLPLGGSNEIGMNFNLYGYGPEEARKWIVVDLGITFGDQTTPGVEVILPDPTYIEAYAKDILGIVLTHAHEDHIGAVAWLWPRLKAPSTPRPSPPSCCVKSCARRAFSTMCTSPRSPWAATSSLDRSSLN